MDKVILINPFEVPAGEEEAALRFWEQAGETFDRGDLCIAPMSLPTAPTLGVMQCKASKP
jgi:hypothetical protein